MHNPIAEETETGGSWGGWAKERKAPSQIIDFRPVWKVLNKSKKQGILKNSLWLLASLVSLALSCIQ